MRRGLLGAGGLRSFPWASDLQVLAIFAAVTAVWVAGGVLVFSYAEQRARTLGILDRESGY